MDWHQSAVLALAAAGILTVILVGRREEGRLAAERLAFFDRCGPLLDRARREPQPAGYPVLTGSYRGRAFWVEPVIDTLSVRKLPSLWLKVTLVEPMPVEATTDILLRPLGTEDFTPFPHLSHQVETPEGFPSHAVVRTDAPLAVAPAEALLPAAALLAKPYGKELLVTPKGVRVVVQAGEGNRLSYLLRQARFSPEPLDPEMLKEAMDAAIAVADGLKSARNGV